MVGKLENLAFELSQRLSCLHGELRVFIIAWYLYSEALRTCLCFIVRLRIPLTKGLCASSTVLVSTYMCFQQRVLPVLVKL